MLDPIALAASLSARLQNVNTTVDGAAAGQSPLSQEVAFIQTVEGAQSGAIRQEAESAYRSVENEVEASWRDPAARCLRAPGTEALEALFKRFGLKYDKQTDGPSIALQMSVVPPTIATLLADLTQRFLR